MQKELLEYQFLNNFQKPIEFQPQESKNLPPFQNQTHMQFQDQSNEEKNLSQLNQNQNINNNEKDDNNLNSNNPNNPKTINQDPNINNNINNNNNNTNEKFKTKLENKFSFWYRISEDIIQYQTPKQALDKNIYESQVKKIHEFDSVEGFWEIFQHLRKPDSCKPGIEFMMFKEPIKPMWEDENNKNGGRMSIKLRKDYTTIIWEEMIFALIGGILPKEMKEEINGIVVTSRKEFNTLQIWFKTFDDRINDDLEQCIRGLLLIPDDVNLEIKQFNKNKKETNEKKSGSNYNYKGYNNFNNYYDDGYENYREEKNQHKKNKHHNYNKNK